MTTDNVNIHGRAGRALPTAAADGISTDIRTSRYGEVFTLPAGLWRRAAARQGTYFYAHNATNDASSTIAGHAAPVLADADATLVKPLIHCINSSAITSTLLCELDFIIIEVVTAGANGTQACWATQLDVAARSITTPGTALTKVNPNMQSANTSGLAVTAGAIVVPAETTSVRHLSHGTHRPSIEVAGDKYIHVFGGEPGDLANSDAAATAVRTFIVNQPPVVLGPNDVFLFALHGQASQSAAGVYKIQVGWTES